MRWPAWLGVGERRWKKSPGEEVQPPKTLWDFLQLLIVPAILVVIALAFNASQASREQKREDRRVREDRALATETRRDANLDAYLTEMRDLILNRHLLTSRKGSAVQSVARMREQRQCKPREVVACHDAAYRSWQSAECLGSS
jgi:hypothetical protein